MPISLSDVAALERNPGAPTSGRLNGTAYTAKFMIPEYGRRLERHYGRNPEGLPVGFPFRHFGLAVTFEKPIQLAVHNSERRLDERLRALLDRYGPLSFCNATLPDRARTGSQRNVFESLSFHIDRGQNQPDNLSLFWRDPYDATQRKPRTSQTLVVANAAAYLQAVRQGEGEHDFKLRYTLFENEEDIGALIGDVLLEIGWRAPEGTGEIAIVDNHRMLHASYYPHAWEKGYPISVRYVY